MSVEDILSGKDYRKGIVPPGEFIEKWVLLALCKHCGFVHGIIKPGSMAKVEGTKKSVSFDFLIAPNDICLNCGKLVRKPKDPNSKDANVANWNIDFATGKYEMKFFELFDPTTWTKKSRDEQSRWFIKLLNKDDL